MKNRRRNPLELDSDGLKTTAKLDHYLSMRDLATLIWVSHMINVHGLKTLLKVTKLGC